MVNLSFTKENFSYSSKQSRESVNTALAVKVNFERLNIKIDDSF